MARAFVLYGSALIMFSYVYVLTILPFMADVGVPIEEVQAYAFFMYLVFLFGLVLLQFAASPRVIAVAAMEEEEEREADEVVTPREGGGGGEEEEEGEGDEPAHKHEKED